MCDFCDTYLTEKKNAKDYKKETGINTTFKVKMCKILTKDRIRRGTLNYKATKLAYCPVCGKKLNEL